MQRKLTTQGPKERSSYTITLPIEWVKKYGLEKSRQVDLSITGSALVIKPEGIEKTKATVDAKILRHSLTRVLQILYKKGVDEIKIINADTKQTSEVYDVISNRCIGYEIIEHKKEYLIIKDIAKEASENFETLLRRCFLLIIEMSREQDKELIKKYDQNLNKLHAYCLRLLIKQGHKDYELVTLYSKLCSLLENIGDDINYMLLFNKTPNKKIQEYLEKCYDLYYSFTPQKFDEVQKLIGAQRYAKTEYFNDLITRKINTMLGMIYGIRG
ncbi:hypothetical protein HZA97_01800 [Candidatus Woesearchaeota archaeon]|nr:hypothetical protein [Candidatus Woesearchaeota archaeon]